MGRDNKASVLAFDIGASSGRAILGKVQDGHLLLKEVHRFVNDPVQAGDTLYWDILRILSEVKNGIKKAVTEAACSGDTIVSIGIDTWGVDFGVIDRYGRLLGNPVHYRDGRTRDVLCEIQKCILPEELYRLTGTQFMSTNTLYQLSGLRKQGYDFSENTGKLLMIPDLLIYFLTGNIGCEMTEASTTQILDVNMLKWSPEVLERFGLPADLFPNIVKPGMFRGNICKEICSELNIPPIPVYTIAEHDTACAVAAIPYEDVPERSAYVSCGTVSIIGTECSKPQLSKAAFANNFTNEIAVNGNIRFAKNTAGMWLLQECRRWWQREGRSYTFAELAEEGMRAREVKCSFDPDDPMFAFPGDIPSRLALFCVETGQEAPSSVGETVRCICRNLAVRHAVLLKTLSEITCIHYDTLHVIGGGSANKLFCDMLAYECGCNIKRGPIEATAIGNCITQLIALSEIKDVQQAREIIERV